MYLPLAEKSSTYVEPATVRFHISVVTALATGLQLDDSDGVPGNGVSLPGDIVRYSYLGGDVVHYKVIGGDHGLNPYSNQVNDLIADFILNQ